MKKGVEKWGAAGDKEGGEQGLEKGLDQGLEKDWREIGARTGAGTTEGTGARIANYEHRQVHKRGVDSKNNAFSTALRPGRFLVLSRSLLLQYTFSKI